ncbi:MAG: hypothetical protein GY906_09550 [bacterium]|nr:hypothetical protein [bacterium]
MKPIDMLLILFGGACGFFWVVVFPFFVIADLNMPQILVWDGVIFTVGLGALILKRFDTKD